MYKPRKCKVCGDEFIPKSSRQYYCKKPIDLICSVCGKHYEGICYPYNPTTCEDPECKKKAGYAGQLKGLSTRICEICGTKFKPVTTNQKTCNREITKTCVICGKSFKDICAPWHDGKTCSDECRNRLADANKRAYWMQTTRKCKLCGKEFHLTTNTALYCEGPHFNTCKVCGKQFEIDASNSDQLIRSVCSKECKAAISSAIFKDPEVRAKQRQTCLDRYGVEHPAQNLDILAKQQATMKSRYGVIAPYYLPQFKNKAIKNANSSKLEQRICTLLDNYGINYVRHHIISYNGHSHEFDFLLPDFNFLIDADGVYFHSYLSDPDGGKVRDDYDEVRLSLIPEGYRFYLIVEGNEDAQIKEIVSLLESISNHSLSEYDSELFRWCRSIEFPYSEYSEQRLLSDWASLNKYSSSKYVPQCRLGESIVKQYHKSIYDCKVGSCVSVKEGWYDDDKLKKVIRNRLIYKNNVDPSKILSGFNISKICPIVSIFNPVLAKYLLVKYANDRNQVFDPFSGFSGRLLGAASLNKTYIGQDLNSRAVNESNQIIKFLQLDETKYSVQCKDILDSAGSYECLLTCPPYNNKEIYNDETVFKSCDEWITECLNRFTCRVYIFVVDETQLYTDYIQEEISNKSHFSNMHEKIVVIHR